MSWPSPLSTKSTNARGDSGARSPESGHRVLGDHVDLLRDLDALDVVAGRQDVAAVDEAGVELAGRTLVSRLCTSGSSVSWAGVTRRWPGPGAEVAARDLLGAQADEQVGVGEVVEPSTPAGLPAGTTISSGVAGEDSGGPPRPGLDDLVHVGAFAEANTSGLGGSARRADDAARFNVDASGSPSTSSASSPNARSATRRRTR